MTWIAHSLNIFWGCLLLIGWIVGIVAWAHRGFSVSRVVHVTARILLLLGIAVTAALLATGVRSLGFSIFMILGFPAWAYVGWFFVGCPPEDAKRETGYDISHALGKREE